MADFSAPYVPRGGWVTGFRWDTPRFVEGSSIRDIAADGTVTCESGISSRLISMPLRLILQNGLNGYSGATDTSLLKEPDLPLEANPGSNTALYVEAVDTLEGGHALLRFDVDASNLGIEAYMQQFVPSFSITNCPTQVVVMDARLRVFGLGGTDTGMPNFRLLFMKDTAPLFDEATADWTEANGAESWDKTGDGFNDVLLGVSDSKTMPRPTWGTTTPSPYVTTSFRTGSVMPSRTRA